MKFSITALVLLLTVAIAAPAPEVQERAAMLKARACPKNALCSGGKCYTVTCFPGPGPNNCSRSPSGGSC
jgi:hypothetical protein